MSIDTLKGLGLIEALDQPLPDSVISYIKNNVATGSGPYGSLTMYDLLGTAAGYRVNDQMNSVNATLATLPLTTLETIYQRMLNTVDGVYGPVTGPVTIPAGPAAGVYTDGDDAFVTGLIPAADAEISFLITTFPVETDSLNQAFDAICAQIENEGELQTDAGIDYDDINGNNQASAWSFAANLTRYGQDTANGGASEFLTTVADTSNLTGQAIVGALREGKNQGVLSAVGVPSGNYQVPGTFPGNPATTTGVPDLITPTDPPAIIDPLPPPAEQSYDNKLSVDYSVNQARGTATVSSVPTVQILGTYLSSSLPRPGSVGLRSNTLVTGTDFWVQARVRPSSSTTLASFTSSSASGQVSVSLTDKTANQDGTFFALPGWLIPTSGVTTLVMTCNEPGGSASQASTTVSVSASYFPESVQVVQQGFFATINEIVVGNLFTIAVTGPASTNFSYVFSVQGTQQTGTGTTDATGVVNIVNLTSPPVGSYTLNLRFDTGATVTCNFVVKPA